MTEQRNQRLSNEEIMGMDSLQLADYKQARLAEARESKLSSPTASPKKEISGGRKAVMGITLAIAGALAMEGIGSLPKPVSGDGGPTAAPTAEATQKPSQAPGTSEPTGTQEPSASPEASPANIQNIEVKQDQPFEVQPGDWISADVTMSNTQEGLKDPAKAFPLFDSDYDYLNSEVKVDITRTALGVDVETPGWVIAPYGDIIVVRGMTADQKAYAIANEIALKTRGGQFDKFDVVTWKGLDNTVNEAGKMHDGTLVGTTGENPTGTPTAENLANMTSQEKLNFIVEFFWNNKIDPNNPDAKELLDILAACLCGCSTPTESPMPSPTPKPSEAVCTPKMTDKVVPAGTVWHSNGVDFIIQGDVTIDGKKTYTVGDPNHDRTIDWVTDGKNHTVVFDYTSDRQLFNNCSTDVFEQQTYNSDKSANTRKIDPKSIILK